MAWPNDLPACQRADGPYGQQPAQATANSADSTAPARPTAPQERPDLASAKGQLVVSNAAMRRQLLELEERILGLLSAAQGNILEDQELVDTLARSKVGGWVGSGDAGGARGGGWWALTPPRHKVGSGLLEYRHQ